MNRSTQMDRFCFPFNSAKMSMLGSLLVCSMPLYFAGYASANEEADRTAYRLAADSVREFFHAVDEARAEDAQRLISPSRSDGMLKDAVVRAIRIEKKDSCSFQNCHPITGEQHVSSDTALPGIHFWHLPSASHCWIPSSHDSATLIQKARRVFTKLRLRASSYLFRCNE